jgi:uncharacterized protein VirK/YbjX
MFEQFYLILRSSNKITVGPESRKNKLSPIKHGPIVGRGLYFLMASLNTKGIVLMKRGTLSQFRTLVEEHSESIPSIFWPYQSISWNVSDRINHLYNHFKTLAKLNYPIDSHANRLSTLVEANVVYPKLRILIDKNDLFRREGMLTLNLSMGLKRVFTIAFSFYTDCKGEICAIAGAIQGRRMADITDLYRDITKKTHGIRPRDLIIEAFLILCRLLGVKKVYAVSESHRQHNHIFYNFKNKRAIPSLNYDEVWSNRGGIRCDDAFFEIPLLPLRKPLREIASKKRAMYRRRYALLMRLEHEMSNGLTTPKSKKTQAQQYYKSTSRLANPIS